jgi:hypothetical protein
MAHYRRGRKVPALPPVKRHIVGAMTVAAVFALVGLTAWQPLAALAAVPVIIALGVLDYLIVTTAPGTAGQLPSGPASVPSTGRAKYADPVDSVEETQVMPRNPFAYARSGDPDVEPDPEAVHTMAIDLRGYLDETGAVRLR